MIGTKFTCNICGQFSVFQPEGDWREAPSCTNCGSSVRARQMAHCVTLGVLGHSQALPSIKRPEVFGVGLSDSQDLAVALASAFSYTNTYYHQPPILDICSPTDDWLGHADFLTSSDVFEHVPSPVSSAFSGAYSVLKDGGILALTVPFDGRETTKEHFPGITQFKTIEIDGEWVMVGKTSSGGFEVNQDLTFHGGPGTTVEMRFFGRENLVQELSSAGFQDIYIHSEVLPEFGIFPPHDQGLPITARKPRSH
ncbi:class I SAM-dependent methyltransferase [Qipengyuania sp. GH25]|uniref:Class I SAM-dependent methyltransferase n=1 Tax=Qipengyuania pacifica TaxID=2860199 RepID=A0ABS7JD05_9SPHN|nr:class I SAM-dependent methyltransferase [Qipengyuania aerophila]MBX7487912.1 class I SAM-dependent methyltransferase [Qipengyuania aerophila]